MLANFVDSWYIQACLYTFSQNSASFYRFQTFHSGPDTKPLFVIVGEGHREVLFRYVERALLHFTNQITPRCLPLSVNNPDVIQSHLLFPGKVCLIDCEAAKDSSGSPDIFCGEHRLLAVSDTGHHRILIVSLEGEVKVSYLNFFSKL